MTGRRPLNMKKYAAIEGQEWTFIDVGDNETVTLIEKQFQEGDPQRIIGMITTAALDAHLAEQLFLIATQAAVWSNVLRQTVHTEESYMGGVGIKGWVSKGQGHPELKELLENTDPLHLSTAFASIGLENECHVDKDAMRLGPKETLNTTKDGFSTLSILGYTFDYGTTCSGYGGLMRLMELANTTGIEQREMRKGRA
ncbi:hypothetical protein BC829DRAFT_418142 [Chytridium lagenaria]|nr:hypothetical protein BC829DRAFT_418142 [Chytridium lagenaria]